MLRYADWIAPVGACRQPGNACPRAPVLRPIGQATDHDVDRPRGTDRGERFRRAALTVDVSSSSTARRRRCSPRRRRSRRRPHRREGDVAARRDRRGLFVTVEDPGPRRASVAGAVQVADALVHAFAEEARQEPVPRSERHQLIGTQTRRRGRRGGARTSPASLASESDRRLCCPPPPGSPSLMTNAFGEGAANNWASRLRDVARARNPSPFATATSRHRDRATVRRDSRLKSSSAGVQRSLTTASDESLVEERRRDAGCGELDHVTPPFSVSKMRPGRRRSALEVADASTHEIERWE